MWEESIHRLSVEPRGTAVFYTMIRQRSASTGSDIIEAVLFVESRRSSLRKVLKPRIGKVLNCEWPVKGVWWIAQGHSELSTHRRTAIGHAGADGRIELYLPFRYAYDVVVPLSIDEHILGVSDNSDYAAFGQPVYAPCDGVAMLCSDKHKDHPPGESGSPDELNFVVIKAKRDGYVFLAHLKHKSLRVRQGEQVQAGDVIAEVGNTGLSTEPHLHISAQDNVDLCQAQGIPVAFSGCLLYGAGAWQECIGTYLREGDIVKRCSV